jgi:hypothetical protein
MNLIKANYQKLFMINNLINQFKKKLNQFK